MSGDNWGPQPPQGDPQQPYQHPRPPRQPPYQPPQQGGLYGQGNDQLGGQGQQFPQQPGQPPGHPSGQQQGQQQGQYGQYGQYQGQYQGQNQGQNQGPYGQPYQPTPTPPRPANRLTMWIGVAVIVVAAGVGGFLLLSDDDDTPATTAVSATSSAKPGANGGGSTGGGKNGGDESGAPEAELDRPMVFPAGPPADAGPMFDATKDAKTWPKACDMLTDAQIKAVFPGGKIKEAKSDTTVSAPYDYPGAADNQCAFELEIPNPADPELPTYGKIELTLNEVSTPAAAKGHYNEYKRDRKRSPFGVFEELGTRLNTDDAYRDDAYIMFYKGSYYVQVYIASGLDGPNGEKLPYDDAMKQYGPTLIGYLAARM